MTDWMYSINPDEPDVDGELPTADYFLRIAQGRHPEVEFGIARAGSMMRAGDRVWLYFSRSAGYVAGLAEVTDTPAPGPDSRYRLWCPMIMLAGPTRALCRQPVRLDELPFPPPQTVRKVPNGALQLLEERAAVAADAPSSAS